MSSLSDDIGDTLALVNQARMAFGKDILTELPDARPGVSTDCLFYRALADVGCTGVDGYGGITFDDIRKANYIGQMWGAGVDGARVKAPGQFKNVISAFDKSGLDHYNTDQKKHF